MNKLIVKPTPAATLNPYNPKPVTPCGNRAIRKRTANIDTPQMPNCFPKNNPAAMPTGIEVANCSHPNPVSETPALRSEEHTSELSHSQNLVCRLLLEK